MVWWALSCSSLPWQVLEAPGKNEGFMGIFSFSVAGKRADGIQPCYFSVRAVDQLIFNMLNYELVIKT